MDTTFSRSAKVLPVLAELPSRIATHSLRQVLARQPSDHHVAIPQVSAPHVSGPHLSVPHMSVPHLPVPHVAMPRVALPHVTLPHVAVPHVSVPSVSVPDPARVMTNMLPLVVGLNVAPAQPPMNLAPPIRRHRAAAIVAPSTRSLLRNPIEGMISRVRRKPVTSVFPNTISERHASGSLGSTVNLIGVRSSIANQLGLLKVATIKTVFGVCDSNEDGFIDREETEVLLELLHLREARDSQMLREMHGGRNRWSVLFRRKRQDNENSMSFEQFIDRFGRLADEFAQFPPHEFIARAKRLKRGFQRCDTNGNSVLSKNELEIGLQKLGFTFIDEELDEIMNALDRNHDGFLEWNEVLYAMWLQMEHPEALPKFPPEFTLDALGDLPSILLPSEGGPSFVPRRSNSILKHRLQIAITTVKTISALRVVTSIPTPRIPSLTRQSSRQRRMSPAQAIDAHMLIKKSRLERAGAKIVHVVAMKRVLQVKNQRRRSMDTAMEEVTAKPIVKKQLALRSRRRASRSGFTVDVRRRIRRIELIAVIVGLLLGALCGFVSTKFIVYLLEMYDLEGSAIYHNDMLYWTYFISFTLGVSFFEVNGLYVTALVAAFRMTVATNLVLFPQDAEREFLTRAIARAALQVSHRKDKIFGIDPMRGSSRIALVVWYVVYKTKRHVLRFMIKAMVRQATRAFAKSVTQNLALVMPVNAFINAWTIRNVMVNCRVSIIGPPCAIAILENFFINERSNVRPFQRVDYLRVLGCVVVCKRCVPPNLELMIARMRREWLNKEHWPQKEGCKCLFPTAEPCHVHPLDDTERLLVTLTLYSRQKRRSSQVLAQQHTRMMVFFLIVALVIDGELEWAERRLYVSVCQAAGFQNQWKSVLRLRDEYLAGHGIPVHDVHATIRSLDHGATFHAKTASPTVADAWNTTNDEGEKTPLGESVRYISHRIATMLSI